VQTAPEQPIECFRALLPQVPELSKRGQPRSKSSLKVTINHSMFAVGKRPFCVWEFDMQCRNIEFSGLAGAPPSTAGAR